MLCMACQGKGNTLWTQNDDVDSIKLDSADYIIEDSLLAIVKIHYEFPTGTSKFATSLRSYVVKDLQSIADNFMQYEDQPKQSTSEPPKHDMIADMKQIVNHCGEQIYKKLSDGARDSYNYYVSIGEQTPLPYSFKKDFRLLYATDKYGTFMDACSEYTGGAHGLFGKAAITFARHTGKQLLVVDTLKAKAMQPIIKAGICEYLNQWYADGGVIGENDSITPSTLSQFLFENAMEDNCVPLPACMPALTPQGVLFFYNPYEIAPYMAGVITFTVPYAQIKPFLTREAKKLLP